MHNKHMNWLLKRLGFRRKDQVWAALGTARANGKDDRYPSGEKHAFLVMAHSDEQHVQERVAALLYSNGWKDVDTERIKLLDRPFHSADAVMVGCYDATEQKGSAVVIYSDPISDL
jgi:hypothetical protein